MLAIGDVVDCKIVEINDNTKQIGLSMKALMKDRDQTKPEDEKDEDALPNSYIEETSFTLGDILDSAETPAEQEAAEEADPVPAEEAPAEAPADETPVEPLEETTEAPVEEAPAEEVPAEEAPAEEAPVEESPVEEAPAEDAE